MTRLDRYMLSQLLAVFGFFSLVLILVYWINRAVILFDRLLADGQGLGVVLTFTALALPSLISIVLPISAFAAAVYVANRLISESELVVMQATGTSPFRLARPILVFGLFVTLLMAILSNVLVPLSNAEQTARQAQLAQTATARLLRDGQFLTPTDGITLFIREITPEGELRDVFLSDMRDPDETVTYTASLAYVVTSDAGPQLVMVDGMAQTLRGTDRRLLTTSFDDLAYDLGDLVPVPDTTRRRMDQLMTWDLFAATPADLEETGRDAAAFRTEAHERISVSLQALITTMVGFATLLVGAFSRFGVWRQIVGAIFLIIGIKIVETAATRAVAADAALWPVLYAPTLLGLGLALCLLLWAARTRRIPPSAGAVA